MQWPRPKSLSGLMLVGLGLMAVPLLAAIVTALLQMRGVADTGQRIIGEGVGAARARQALFAAFQRAGRSEAARSLSPRGRAADADARSAAPSCDRRHAENAR